jgi:DNA-binding protein Fis
MNEEIPITPETKISALLDHYPQLEEVLIEMAPAFKKLRNPILRKTVARVATLRQVAEIGDVPLGTLINKLRSIVGQTIDYEVGAETIDSSAQPDWFDPSKIVKSLDARSMIESGQPPVSQVLKELKGLKSGEIYELIMPFVPAPLLDMAKKRGFKIWSKQMKADVIQSYFYLF